MLDLEGFFYTFQCYALFGSCHHHLQWRVYLLHAQLRLTKEITPEVRSFCAAIRQKFGWCVCCVNICWLLSLLIIRPNRTDQTQNVRSSKLIYTFQSYTMFGSCRHHLQRRVHLLHAQLRVTKEITLEVCSFFAEIHQKYSGYFVATT